MTSLNELTTLKDKVERIKREADRAAGALEQTLKSLNEEFGCDSIEKGKRMLKKMEAEEAEAKEAFDDALAKFKEEYKDELERS